MKKLLILLSLISCNKKKIVAVDEHNEHKGQWKSMADGKYYDKIPETYSKVEYYTDIKAWYTEVGNWTTFEHVWAENKPTGIIKVTTFSHSPLEPTIYDKVEYTKRDIKYWKIKPGTWVSFEPIMVGNARSKITKITTYSYERLVPLQEVKISYNSGSTITYNGFPEPDTTKLNQ